MRYGYQLDGLGARFEGAFRDAFCRLVARDTNTGHLARVADLDVCLFSQLWSSTALGFGGIGGQAMSTAPTLVVWDDCWTGSAAVYFNWQFAYLIVEPNDHFFADLQRKRMEPVNKSTSYERQREPATTEGQP